MDPARTTQLALGFWPARAFSAAAEVGLLRLLAEAGPLDAVEVAARLELRSPSLPDLLDALVGLGVLGRAGDRYSVAPAADPAPGLLGMADGDAYRAWADLPDALRLGRRPGPTMFERLADDPDALARFVETMGAVSEAGHEAIASALGPGAAGATVLDVGGADGRLAVRLARRHPGLTCTTFDLPALLPLTEATIAASGVGDRVQAVGGDLLVDPWPPADVVVLSHVLLDWDTPTKRRILGLAASALLPGGRLLVLDRTAPEPDGDRTTFDLLRSLHLLVTLGDAHHFTQGELASWLAEAGLGAPAFDEVGDGSWLAVAAVGPE